MAQNIPATPPRLHEDDDRDDGLPIWLWPALLGILALIVIPLLLGRCGLNDSWPQDFDAIRTGNQAIDAEATTTTAPATTAPPTTIEDSPVNLAPQLNDALAAGGFATVRGTVDGNQAILTGVVESEQAKADAEAAALAVAGIDSVDNRLEVVETEPPAPETNTIVDVAASDPQFSSLVTALGSAGLTNGLAGTGPFTVFAPTNDAFDDLDVVPEGDDLIRALAYHVVPGRLVAADLETGTLTTVQGQVLNVVNDGGTVTVNGVNVSIPDIEADNGVIHAIDGVLNPRPETLNETLDIQNITFQSGSAVITAEGLAELDATVVPYMTDNPDAQLKIDGHTDSDGSAAANQLLSENRANAVRDYLVQQGIDSERMETEGFGATVPLVPNDSPENKAQNRRIEFTV